MSETGPRPFTERLSWFMALSAAAGGIYVILDPVITFSLDWVEIKLGGEGFSEQLKGAVVALILIEGWKAVKEYWLGSSAAGNKQQESMTRIAESAPNVAAAVVKAAAGDAIKAADMKVDVAGDVTVTQPEKEKG